MRRPILLILIALAGVASAGAPEAADDWWNAAWSHRKRVQVSLPAMKPIPWGWKPASETADDIVPAQAVLHVETDLKAGAQREVRVVDGGGNVLPAVISGPDTRGLLRVTFPARRSIIGQTAAPITEGTKTVELSVGRDRAVTPGLRFHVLGGHEPVATLEVQGVAEKTSVARVIETKVPQIATGTRVQSVPLSDAEYFVYYGNPAAAEASPVWTPPASPVRRYTWQITSGGPPTSIEMLKATLRSGVSYVGSSSLTVINSSSNSHATSSEGFYVAAYETYVTLELPGLYRFSIDSYGPSYLLIDGEVVAERAGFHMQHGQWEHRGKIELGRGAHHLVMFAVESGKRASTRLGWQPVTSKVYGQTPVSFYITRVKADAVGFETRGQRRQAFFTYSLAPRSVLVGGKARYQFVQLHNHTPLDETDEANPVTWQWQLGDDASRDRSPGRLFPLPEGSTAAPFDVTLKAIVGGKQVGEHRRTVYCDPRPAQKLNVALDVVSFANIVYDDERTSIAVRLRNANLSPVALRAVARRITKKDTEVILQRRVLIGAEDEDFAIVPVDMKQLDPKRAIIELDFFVAGERVLGTSFRVVPSPEGLAKLRRGLGSLHDGDDRRVMICAEIEDRDRHLRWVFYNYLAHDLMPRMRKTRRSILLFGDRMANPVAPDKAFADYTRVLDAQLKKDGRQLQIVDRSTGLLPTLADLILFAKTLDTLKTMPDLIILSPGLADVAQACGDRDFARSIDVLIDAIRARRAQTKIIVVSPPPYPVNPRLSAHYSAALRRVAREHHLPYLDLHALLTQRTDDWVQAWYAAPDADGIFLQNPNEQAHRRIAEALAKLVY